MNTYAYTKKLDLSFSEALDQVEFHLLEQGFWILTRIDVKAKMKEKLWKEIQEYMILWACNPTLAYQAIQEEYEIWLLLPCNVIVYEKWEQVHVSCVIPSAAMGMIENSAIWDIAKTAEEKLKRAIDTL